MGVEEIVSSIKNKAELTAKNIIESAEAEKQAVIDSARIDMKKKKEESLLKAKQDGENVISRRLTLANLDSRKMILSSKQKLIDNVYYLLVTKLLNMTDNIYREYIGEMVCKYAENGDTIQTSERDSRRLNEEWVKGLAKKTGLILHLSNEYHSDRGGIMLLNLNYDKNLTFSTMVKDLRSQYEGKVAKKLFDNGSN